jgi:hypothetical protein
MNGWDPLGTNARVFDPPLQLAALRDQSRADRASYLHTFWTVIAADVIAVCFQFAMAAAYIATHRPLWMIGFCMLCLLIVVLSAVDSIRRIRRVLRAFDNTEAVWREIGL